MTAHGAPRPLLTYVLPILVALSLTAVVDALIIVPMVEVDPGLDLTVRRSSLLEEVRDIAPTTSPVLLILSVATVYAYRLHRGLREAPRSGRTAALVLRGPRRLGLTVAAGWTLAFLIGLVIDLATLSFARSSDALIYYGSSAVAIVSTGLFGFLVTYLVLDEMNKRFYIGFVFPEGNLSATSLVRPVPFPGKLMSLWFAVGFFPLLVLALGTFTRRFVPENEMRAYLFIAIFIPAGALLTYRTGRTVQRPLTELVAATRDIAAGRYRLSLRSTENDDVGYLIDSTLQMATALEEKALLSETFGRAVDPRVRDHLLAGNIRLGGERVEAAVLFCDIRGFTGLSETRREEEVVAILNGHLEAMDEAVRAHGGMINKFLGDGLLAVFGVPLADPDACAAALRCARDMVHRNETLNDVRRLRGEPALRLGIGLHYGPVVAGNIGSAHRMEYTIIGDTVNLASRIQGLSKRVEHQIIVSDEVVATLGEEDLPLALKRIGRVRVRGRERPVLVWGA